MRSQLLLISAKYIKPIFLIISFIVLYRGHNLPGGGFIGGLLAASGYIYYMMAYDVEKVIRKMWIKPDKLMASGLMLALGSGLIAVFDADSFMTGKWISVFGIKLGTPTIFDFGVYLAVFGVIITIMMSVLDKQEKWD
jgi:multisubunit Na+/H+ antiporter MnhB subunit